MYTVLIQSKRTMDTVHQYYPLFSKAVEQGKIGFCQWVESGDTVDTALPELYDLISHKRAWRAIILCTELDKIDAKFPTDDINPFDYLDNKDCDGFSVENGKIVDCKIPLIRLTHMLGGIPAPEPEFESKITEYDNKIPVREYFPVKNNTMDQRKKAYTLWNDERTFQGIAPTEILLIKVRKELTESETNQLVRESWKVHTEADSSLFWKRNLYPHSCRFLTYDLEQRGKIRMYQEMFKLLSSVLIVAENDIDPNVIQAHRLYKMNIFFNQNQLKTSFQDTVNKLNMAKYQLKKSIEKDDEEINKEKTAPDYVVSVPIAFQFDKVSKVLFRPNDYNLTHSYGTADMENWNSYSKSVKQELKEVIKNVDRNLDQAAKKLREKCHYKEESVEALTEYQKEDLELSLEEIYKDILRGQVALPSSITDVTDQAEVAEKEVKELLKQRMTKIQLLTAILIAVLSVIVCLLPAFAQEGAWPYVTIMIAVFAIVLSLSALIVLILKKKELTKAALNFQNKFQKVLSEISHNASEYSNFLSNIASHIHGSSYLNIMENKKARKNSSYYSKTKHIKSIENFLEKISNWSIALYADVDMNSVEAVNLIEDNINSINYDNIYTFDQGKSYSIELNQTGVYLKSPFKFVDRIEIEREGIYDDVRNN